MHTKTHHVMKNLVLCGLAATALFASSGCCSKCCRSHSCPDMTKKMSGCTDRVVHVHVLRDSDVPVAVESK